MTTGSVSPKMEIKVPRFSLAALRRMQGEFNLLVQAESDLDTECKRLRKAVRRLRRSDCTNSRLFAKLQIVLRDITKYRSRLKGLLERIDFVGLDGSLCVGEVQGVRRMIGEELNGRDGS